LRTNGVWSPKATVNDARAISFHNAEKGYCARPAGHTVGRIGRLLCHHIRSSAAPCSRTTYATRTQMISRYFMGSSGPDSHATCPACAPPSQNSHTAAA
jgi:hypothetical protein